MSVETRLYTGASKYDNFVKYVHAIGVASLGDAATGTAVRVSVYDGTSTSDPIMWQIACPAGEYRGQAFNPPLLAASGGIYVQIVDQAAGSGVSGAARAMVQAH